VPNPHPCYEAALIGGQTTRLNGLLPRLDAAAKAAPVMSDAQRKRFRCALVAALGEIESVA
jgi:hypothetical protein